MLVYRYVGDIAGRSMTSICQKVDSEVKDPVQESPCCQHCMCNKEYPNGHWALYSTSVMQLLG